MDKKNHRRSVPVIKKSEVYSSDPQPIECVISDMSERILKIQRDLLMPAIIFEKNKIQHTITFFGASRIKPEAQAKEELAKVKKNPKAKDYAQKLKMARKAVASSKYYTAAQELAKRLQEWINLKNFKPEDKLYIMTGGGPGIMEAAARGSCAAGGTPVGATISIHCEKPNEYVEQGISFNFNYFLMRKFWLLFFAKAIVVFPGGVGTFDELFEVFTLIKTRKTQSKIPMVLFGKKFWKSAVNFKTLVDADVITEKDLDLIEYVDTVDEAFKYIIANIK